MAGYSYASPGAGAAYLGMMGHLGPMRESRGPPAFGAASYGMYKGGYGGGGGGHRIPRSSTSSYGSYASTPQPSSMFSSPYGSGSRSSRTPSARSPYGSSYESSYGSGSPYSSGSFTSYDSAKSFMTDYRPRSGWFSGRRSGGDYPPFPSDFEQSGATGRRRSFPRHIMRPRWSFGSR